MLHLLSEGKWTRISDTKKNEKNVTGAVQDMRRIVMARQWHCNDPALCRDMGRQPRVFEMMDNWRWWSSWCQAEQAETRADNWTITDTHLVITDTHLVSRALRRLFMLSLSSLMAWWAWGEECWSVFVLCERNSIIPGPVYGIITGPELTSDTLQMQTIFLGAAQGAGPGQVRSANFW